MKKKEYTDLINNKPWQWMSEHFDKLEKFVPVKIAKCNINPEEWIKFSCDYFDHAHQNKEMPQQNIGKSQKHITKPQKHITNTQESIAKAQENIAKPILYTIKIRKNSTKKVSPLISGL